MDNENRLRFSVSLVKQGKHQFYTLTMPSEVLARTCSVTTRKEDPEKGFQRELDAKRAKEIAEYIDRGLGTIPSSIVLSAQESAELKIVGRGKTIEFTDTPGAFLILDGQHRVYGFSKAKTSLRVPVVIYNGLSRTEETRLFIDINTKQKPVPSQLLLDIKQLADIETETEQTLRDIFDLFDKDRHSALAGYMSPAESARNKITRVTFNQAAKPLLGIFPGRESTEIYEILNSYVEALNIEIVKKTNEPLLSKPVVFRAFMAFFKPVAQRVVDKFGNEYSASNFHSVIAPVFQNMQIKKLEKPGTSWSKLKDYLEERLSSKLVL
ncbi:DGQHR domain-containing protein [Hyphococcus sp.]|uniref:DGQHR domain-containing protein n=1 Tax=Hyphococcus sp. TaxID=2038636 RepID=UPI0035C7581A